MALYREDWDKKPGENALCDMIEECGEGYDEEATHSVRHMNDTSAN
jgi:hypothetical protein